MWFVWDWCNSPHLLMYYKQHAENPIPAPQGQQGIVWDGPGTNMEKETVNPKCTGGKNCMWKGRKSPSPLTNVLVWDGIAHRKMIRTWCWMRFLNYTWHRGKLWGWASHRGKLRGSSWLWGGLWIEHITGDVKSSRPDIQLKKKINCWLKVGRKQDLNRFQGLGLMEETTDGGSWSEPLSNRNHSSLKVKSWNRHQIQTRWLSLPWKRSETGVKTNIAPELRLNYQLEDTHRLKKEYEQV